MGFFRAAGRAYGKVNSAVIKATSPRKWRKSVDNYQQGHHDFSKSTNVANLRVSRGKESYDLLIDNDEIHVAYQDKQGKTQWRKAADVGDFTAIDPGKPPSPQGLNRHWANTYKTSGGTYKGFDAKVKYLQDYGYQVAALDKRPYKAWRSGDKKTAESYVQQVESGQRLQGTPEFFGDYIDPKQAHSTADQQYRRRFFQDVSGQSWQQQKGRVWTGSAWRRPPNPPQPPPPTSGPPPVRPTPKGPSAGPSASTGPTTGKQSRINFGGNPPQNPNPGKGWRFSQNQAVVPPHSAVKPPKTASTDLGEGFSLVPRKNAGGQDATVHFADDRVMVRMKDSQGRESWVYRSAHGTSGKKKADGIRSAARQNSSTATNGLLKVIQQTIRIMVALSLASFTNMPIKFSPKQTRSLTILSIAIPEATKVTGCTRTAITRQFRSSLTTWTCFRTETKH